jgi:hypothetical protein
VEIWHKNCVNILNLGHSGVREELKIWVEELGMLAYELYWLDETKKTHFIGILPERRKKPERITQNSILNWGKLVIGDDAIAKDIYFVKVEF